MTKEYEVMKNKECTLLDFYDKEDLDDLKVEADFDCNLEFDKDYFLSNKFIFKYITDDKTVIYFKNKEVSFYIDSWGNYSYDDCFSCLVLIYNFS